MKWLGTIKSATLTPTPGPRYANYLIAWERCWINSFLSTTIQAPQLVCWVVRWAWGGKAPAGHAWMRFEGQGHIRMTRNLWGNLGVSKNQRKLHHQGWAMQLFLRPQVHLPVFLGLMLDRAVTRGLFSPEHSGHSHFFDQTGTIHIKLFLSLPYLALEGNPWLMLLVDSNTVIITSIYWVSSVC